MTDPMLFPEHVIVADPPLPPLDGYVILAYWQHGGWWRIWADIWGTEEAARQHSMELSRGWIHRRILRLQIGEPVVSA